MEIHRDTKMQNVRNGYVYLNREVDLNFDSQLRFYLNYNPLVVYKSINVAIVDVKHHEMVFQVNDQGRGYIEDVTMYFIENFYKDLVKCKNELRRGILEGYRYSQKMYGNGDRHNYNVRIGIYYMIFGFREVLKIIPEDVSKIILPNETFVMERVNAKFHRFENLKKLFISSEINILTLPEKIEHVVVMGGGKVPDCLQNKNFYIQKSSNHISVHRLMSLENGLT